MDDAISQRVRVARRVTLAPVALLLAAACGAAPASPAASAGTSTMAPSVSASAAPTVTEAATTVPTSTPADTGGTATGSGSTPAGYVRTTVADASFSIAVPKGWQSVNLSGSDIDAMIAKLDKTNPEMANLLRVSKSSGQTFSFVALDLVPAEIDGGYAANVNVLRTPSSGFSLSLIADVTEGALKNVKSITSSIDRSDTHLPAGDAVRLRYTIGLDADRSVVTTQYLLADATNAWVLTFSATSRQLPKVDDTFRAIAGGFQELH